MCAPQKSGGNHPLQNSVPGGVCGGCQRLGQLFCFEIWKSAPSAAMTCPASATVCTRKRPARSCAVFAPTSRPARRSSTRSAFEPLRRGYRRASVHLCHVRARPALRGQGRARLSEIALDSTLHAEDTGSALVPVDDVSPCPQGRSWPTSRRCCTPVCWKPTARTSPWSTWPMRSGTPIGCAGCSPVSTACAGCFLARWSPLFGRRGFITGHVSPRQLDKRLPTTGPTRLPASITTAACLRCCQRQFSQ